MTDPTPTRPASLAALRARAWRVALALAIAPVACAEPAVAVPPPALDLPADGAASDTAVLAGGCFWGVQGVFQHVAGVSAAVSGYAGGDGATAHYEQVGQGDTGHAEAVRITYDPRRISYGRLLQIYFAVAHDPTQRDRQGPDSGPQYRSAIFPASDAQARVARAYISQLSAANTFGKPLATTVEAGKAFYPAEPHHQDFLVQNPHHPYIVVNDLPKVEHLKAMFPAAWQEAPALVNAAH